MTYVYPKFKIIVAYLADSRAIGFDLSNSINQSQWPNLKADLQHFKETTTHNIVIMGRKTWETLPEKSRPLKNRINIVVTRNKNYEVPDGVFVKYSVLDAILLGHLLVKDMMDVFVIGGGEIYRQALALDGCTQIYASEISPSDNNLLLSENLICFPEVDKNGWHRQVTKVTEEDGYKIKFVEFIKLSDIRSMIYTSLGIDSAYLGIMGDIISNGCFKDDRTGVGVLSTFGQTIKWNFTKSTTRPGYYTFPLLTTKRLATKSIIEELLFFLRGNVDNDVLASKGVPIWNGNTTREFLDNRGLTHMEDGSLGKAYGFQWRHWGAEWKGKSYDYTKDPNRHDQIANIINTLKTDPTSRRMVLSAWNVSDLDEMCLPPCHLCYVFNVQYKMNVPYLYCHMTQRSADMFLGVPFNIASTALLTMILAKVAGMEPGGISINFVDAHIYTNHIEQVKIQRKRSILQPPIITINKSIESIEDIEQLQLDDFKLADYYYHPRIKAPMAV